MGVMGLVRAAEDGRLCLKDGQLQFRVVDSVFGEHFEHCQMLENKVGVSHCRLLPGLPTTTSSSSSSVSTLRPMSFLSQDADPDSLQHILSTAATSDGLQQCWNRAATLQCIEANAKDEQIAVTDYDSDSDDDDESHDDYGILSKSGAKEAKDQQLLAGSVGEDALLESGKGAARDINEFLKNASTSSTNASCLQSRSCISRLVDHLQETHSATGVSLTPEELEEEAVLLLVRHFNDGRGRCDRGSNSICGTWKPV